MPNQYVKDLFLVLEGRSMPKEERNSQAIFLINKIVEMKLLQASDETDDSGLNAVNAEGRTFLILAILYDYDEIIHFLLAMGADPNWYRPLYYASPIPNAQIVDWLLAAGGDIELGHPKSESLLYSAFLFGNACLISILLNNGADPNQVDRFGIPMLLLAIRRNDLAIVELLVSANAIVDKIFLQEALRRKTVPIQPITFARPKTINPHLAYFKQLNKDYLKNQKMGLAKFFDVNKNIFRNQIK